MKFRLTILFLFLSGCLTVSSSQNLFTDDFEYPVQDSLEGLGGWNRTSSNSNYNVKVVSPGLTYNGYPGSGIGNCVYFTNNPDGDVVKHQFATQTSGNLYLAFMFKVEYLGMTAPEGFNICFDEAGSPTNHNTAVYIQKITSTYRFGIAKRLGQVTYESSGHSVGYTYLVVVKYSFVTGNANDRVKLYVFTTGIPAVEPANSNAETTAGNDMLDIGEIVLTNSFLQSGLNMSRVKIDGIRIGTSWEGVVPLAVNQTSSEVPEGYSLSQNYPNPFNPVTNINFSIPESEHVRITVKDILGKQVASLVDEKLNSGTYSTNWDASNFPSGVYFYRLEAGKYKDVRKMILVK